MRKMIQKGIVVLLMVLIGGYSLNINGVYAMTKKSDATLDERVLPVKITRADGIVINPRDREAINTNMQLEFTMDKQPLEDMFEYEKGVYEEYAKAEELLKVSAKCQYSISNDKGMSYSKWEDIEGDCLRLAPGAFEEGEYRIRFRKLQEYVLDEDRADAAMIAAVIADNMAAAEASAAREEDTEEADSEAEDDRADGNEVPDKEHTGAEGTDSDAYYTGTEEIKTSDADAEDKGIAVTGEEGDEEGAQNSDAEKDDGNISRADREQTVSGNSDMEISNEDKENAEEEKKEYEEETEEIPAGKKEAEICEEMIQTAEQIISEEGRHSMESVCYTVIIDTAAPVLELMCDADDGEWVNTNVKCSVKINDTGSGPAGLKVSFDNNALSDESFTSDNSTSGTGRSFVLSNETRSDNGGELVIEAWDRAGNVSILKQRIGIDKTAPSITLDGVQEGKIYNKAAAVSVTGNDDHPSGVCVGYSVKRMVMGTEETIAASAMTLDELKGRELCLLDVDGDYVVECHATDRAGNAYGPIRKTFRVDTTAPGILLEGITDKAVLNKEGALKITAFDNFEDGYNVSIKGTYKAQNGTSDLRLADYKTEGLISSNTYYFKNDGEYELTVKASDSAGNTYEENLGFSVDRTAPVITMTEGLKIKDEMITNEPPTLNFRIVENNYGTSKVFCDLKKRKGMKGFEPCKSPEWIMTGETADFSLTVEEEGSYELTVKAVDAAGNSSVKTMRFTLDMTSPQIDYIENLDRKYIKSFKLPGNFGEFIKDQNDVSYQTYLNSMNYDEGEEVAEDGKYVLKVSAVDDAGNQTEKSVEFIVDGTMPRVVIDGMADDGSVNKDETIVLSLYDEGDYFRSVKLNGEEAVTGDRQTSVELAIPDYGDYTIDIEAVDMADNILTQTIEAKCANAAPAVVGASTVRTLKQANVRGTNKGLRVFLIVMTVLVLAGSVVVFCYYNNKESAV